MGDPSSNPDSVGGLDVVVTDQEAREYVERVWEASEWLADLTAHSPAAADAVWAIAGDPETSAPEVWERIFVLQDTHTVEELAEMAYQTGPRPISAELIQPDGSINLTEAKRVAPYGVELPPGDVELVVADLKNLRLLIAHDKTRIQVFSQSEGARATDFQNRRILPGQSITLGRSDFSEKLTGIPPRHVVIGLTRHGRSFVQVIAGHGTLTRPVSASGSGQGEH